MGSTPLQVKSARNTSRTRAPTFSHRVLWVEGPYRVHVGRPIVGHKQGGALWHPEGSVPGGPPLLSFNGSWRPPPRGAPIGWCTLAPETNCLRGATPFFMDSYKEAGPWLGTNKLAHSCTRNTLCQGGHPLFHSLGHGCHPLMGQNDAGALWRLKRIVPGGAPLLSFSRSWRPPPRGAQVGWCTLGPKTQKTRLLAVKGPVAHNGQLTTCLGPVKGKGGRGRVDVVRVGRGAPLGMSQEASARGRRPLTHSLRSSIPATLLGGRHQIGPIPAIALLKLVHHVSIHLWQVLHLQASHRSCSGPPNSSPQLLPR